MKLYGFGPTRALRPLWALQELGVDFEYVRVDLPGGEARSPAFLALNPAAKVPVLVDGDLVLTESVAIVLYLAEKFPRAKLMPEGLAERADAYRWLMFTATELEQPLWRIAKQTSLYPPDKRVPADVPRAQEDFAAMAKVMQDDLRGRTFVVGDHVTMADFVLAYTLDWAGEAGLLGDFPELRAYVDRMYARPKAVSRIQAELAKLRA
jgi:glutathione S-transferase